MRKTNIASSKLLKPLALFVSVTATANVVQADTDTQAKSLLETKCTTCHLPDSKGGLGRIHESRRTPEGWAMTLERMSVAHGVKVSQQERKVLIKYLADNLGLAPSETAEHRDLLERNFVDIEVPDNKLVAETCARCHSYGRIALQRRTEDDWRKLAHFHVGQYPVVEIQAGGRDRYWWEIASTKIPEVLGEIYSFDTDSWKQWQQHKGVNAAGSWRFTGHRPGWGSYEGVATIKASAEKDHYTLDMKINYANGKEEQASGDAIIYTGYEWRATVKQGDDEVRQIFQLSPDGQSLSGRWHKVGVDSLGGHFNAVRTGVGLPAKLMSAEPAYIRAGSTEIINFYGANLSGDLGLGPGLEVVKIIESSPEKVIAEVRSSTSAEQGLRAVTVGDATLQKGLAVYTKIDFIKIEPNEAMANVGGNGGSRPKIPVQFEAVGYTYGPDGKAGTKDDIRLGYFPASWSVDNLNENAVAMQDDKFAGKLLSNGLFIPGDAGPNPERKYEANNIGELKITATVKDSGRSLEASKPFVVTVQRWNDPYIR